MASRAGAGVRSGPHQFFEGVAQELEEFARLVYSAPTTAPHDREPPEVAAHLWQWFSEIALSRTGNGYGANPVQPSEILSWAKGMNIAMTRWEFSTLRRMEAAVIPILNRKKPDDGPVNEVSATDTAGVSALFAGLRARAAAAFPE
jgi:hypothetical protein